MEELFAMAFVGGDVFEAEAHSLHICFDEHAESFCLFGAVFLQPPTNHIEQSLHRQSKHYQIIKTNYYKNTSGLLRTKVTHSLPVKGLMLLPPLHQHFSKHLTQEVVVRLFLELQLADVLKEAVQHQAVLSERLHQIVDLGHLLQATDLGVLFSLGVDLNSLPG